MDKRHFPPATIDTVIAEITHAADAGGANEARCLQWVSDLTALRAEAPPPRINVKCETVDNGITGVAFLNVIRVEQEDDGSLTAVIDPRSR